MGGLFMPDHFVFEASSDTDVQIASIAWGFQLGFTVLTASKAAAQAVRIWRRVHRVTPYILMAWIEIIANFCLGTLSWIYLIGKIEPSFHYYMIIVACWSLELQCLIQIIRNRIALLIHSEREKFWLKWGSFAIVLGINVSVFVVWVPARLQISPFWINLNNIWDRIEKVIFFFFDGGLNVYFIVLVKRKLLSSGMTKYQRLFQFNITMVIISLSLDIILIGLMSLPNGLIYAQFHPVVYMIKLNIEMSMAALIGKVARSQDGSTPSGPSMPGDIKMNTATGGHRKKGKSNGESGYANDTMSPTKKRFNPTVSEIMASSSDEQRMYHAWVSADAAPRYGESIGRDQKAGWDHRGAASGAQLDDDDDEEKGYIRKHTQISVAEEVFTDPTAKREPSEDGSTLRLKP